MLRCASALLGCRATAHAWLERKCHPELLGLRCLCPAGCCPRLCSLLGIIVLGLAWVRPGKTWQSGNILFLGKIIPHGEAFLALSPSRFSVEPRGPLPRWVPAARWVSAAHGCQPLLHWGLDAAQGRGGVRSCAGAGITRLFQVSVSSPLEVAPLGQAASLPSVPTPGVEQEDFHCC